jgi:hypothetical protein
MESFFDSDRKEAANTPVISKKRARVVNEVDQELKSKARLYCSSPEQWQIVSRYSTERLRAFCENHEFRQQGELNNTVFSFIQRAISLAIDYISLGDGYIKKEIENDISLRQSIELEAGSFVSLLSNKFKIISLLTIDSTNGKLNQMRNRPLPVEITELKNEQPTACLFESADFPGEFGMPEATVCEETRTVPGIDGGSATDPDLDGQKE